MGTDEAALDAVVAADVELMALRAEEADIQSRLNAVSLDDRPADDDALQPSTSAANDADNDRLAEIYERLAVSILRMHACKKMGLFPSILSASTSLEMNAVLIRVMRAVSWVSYCLVEEMQHLCCAVHVVLNAAMCNPLCRKWGRIAQNRARPRFCTAWGSQRRCSGGLQMSSLGDGACASPWQERCISSLPCCYWTSPPITWTSELSSGWR